MLRRYRSAALMIWVYPNGWPIPPGVLLGCLAAAVLYIRGWRVLAKEELSKKVARAIASPAVADSRGAIYQWDSWLWRAIYFQIAIFLAIIGDSAPIDILSARFFWVHMIQHLLLLVIIAPLLVAAAPLQPVWLGLPGWMRRLVSAAVGHNVGHGLALLGNWLRQPILSCGLLIAGIWIWHWPTLYDLALINDAIHDWCEHLTFLLVSVLFWTQIIPSPSAHPRLGYLGQMACVGFAIAQNVVLAVLLGFAQTPYYAPYVHMGILSGISSALQDQQLGAGIMWTFGDVPFGIALGILFQRWLATQLSDTNATAQAHHQME
jgi:putative membrane protein